MGLDGDGRRPDLWPVIDPDHAAIAIARPPKRRRPVPPAISRVVYAAKRGAGAVLPSAPEITEEELARRRDAADRLMQDIKRKIGQAT